MIAPLASIVIPCYNSKLWIVQAIESCINQIPDSVEVIVVDDGSLDGSADVVDRYAKAFPGTVRLIRQTNQGAPVARNVGAEAAQGKFVAFLDADDYLAQGSLAALIKALEARTHVAYGNVNFVNGKGEILSVREQTPASEDWVVVAIETGAWTSSRLIRREVLKTCKWVVGLPCAQDYEFLINCAVHGFKFGFVPQVVANVRLHDSPSRITVRNRGSATPFLTRVAVNHRFETDLAQMGALFPRRKAALHYSLLADAVSLWRLGKHDDARRVFESVDQRSARKSGCFSTLDYNTLASFMGLRVAGWAWQVRNRLRPSFFMGTG